MFETTRKLKVPEDVSVRETLKREAARLIKQEGILPPVRMEQLKKLAADVIQNAGADPIYLDFAIVLCGNEVWREVVAATPYERRLLLLPQCLKNPVNCKAEVDSLGLICAGCKACQIDSVLSKAESLGYTTLVAEGTTVAVGLVEEGAIDAVIGVSCMPVLQRSFEPVSRAAVPVIGLPLLYDGCESTNLDYHWLFDELGRFNQDDSKAPLSVSLLKDQVLDYFSDQGLRGFFQPSDETEKLAKRMLMMGGQRIRPLLSVLAYRSYAGQLVEEVQKSLAVIVECFHKASLIHDDIEDDDDSRYEQETLHSSHGIPIAINVGDFLIGKGYQLLGNLPVEAQTLVGSLRVVSSSHLNLSVGQGADLLLSNQQSIASVDELLHIFARKTGEAVKVALLLGAIIGGAPQEDLDCLSIFSDWFGIAYQIRDDLNEFREEQPGSHVHHFPFLLALLKEMLEKSGNLSDPKELHEKDLSALKQMILEEQVDQYADEFLKLYVAKCYQELDKLQNLKLKLSLYGVMGKIF